MTHRLVDISSLPDEKAKTIADLLLKTLHKLENNFVECVAFGGDNCNTNFGSFSHSGKNNVFSILKENISNMQGSGCSAHVLNNCIQNSVDALDVDVERILFKIYDHFSIYTVRVEQLKEFCNFVEIDYKRILSHCKTRWLSLYPVINRVLQMYSALQSYFLSIDRPPMVLKSFFENWISEAYLLIVHSLAYSFQENMLQIEKKSSSVVETINTLNDVKNLLKIRIETKFLPLTVISLLQKNKEYVPEIEKFKKCTFQMYQDALDYLEKWTSQFESFKVFHWMTQNEVTWENIVDTMLFLKKKNIIINDALCLNQFANYKQFIEKTKVQSTIRFQKNGSHILVKLQFPKNIQKC